MTSEKISWEKIYQIKRSIEQQTDIKSLKNFYENINNSSDINDDQKEYLTNEDFKKCLEINQITPREFALA